MTQTASENFRAGDDLLMKQICLVAPTLEPCVGDIAAIFGLQVCYRDPNVGRYGLENALLPIGPTLLEVVAPTEEGTAAGRFLDRIKGHGGYMVIFSCADPWRWRKHAEDIGVRVAHVIDRPNFRTAQLHPRDCRAAFLDFNTTPGSDGPMGAYAPAGPDWQKFIRTDRTRSLAEVELESPDPQDLARHWSRIIGVPADLSGAEPRIAVPGAVLRFIKGNTECLGGLVLEAADPDAVLNAAKGKGYAVSGNAFHLGGVNFRVRKA